MLAPRVCIVKGVCIYVKSIALFFVLLCCVYPVSTSNFIGVHDGPLNTGQIFVSSPARPYRADICLVPSQTRLVANVVRLGTYETMQITYNKTEFRKKKSNLGEHKNPVVYGYFVKTESVHTVRSK